MTIELTDDGYEKIEAAIQEIENIAQEGAFAGPGAVKRFQQIVGKANALRQTLLEVVVLNPFGGGGGGEAA
jgi:hypothetical protein